jgi:hypothetical protein
MWWAMTSRALRGVVPHEATSRTSAYGAAGLREVVHGDGVRKHDGTGTVRPGTVVGLTVVAREECFILPIHGLVGLAYQQRAVDGQADCSRPAGESA